MKIGEKIHRIRKERGYTAEQFAEMLGISAVSLRKYEYGERMPKDPMIAEIARCLEVNPSSLKSDTHIVRIGGGVLPRAYQGRRDGGSRFAGEL